MRTLGQKPTFAEMLEYYDREDVRSFIYEASLKRKIRMFFAAEMSWSRDWPDNFLELEKPEFLRDKIVTTFMESMSKLAEDEPMGVYPSFHEAADRLSDYKDLIFEADRKGWRKSFDDLYGATEILDEFQVTYRIKFSGHRSLHLMIPWESFPEHFNGKSVKRQWQEIISRTKAYFSRRGGIDQAHRPGGILRVAYSLNENTGLVSLPIRKDALEDFRPWEANIYNAKVDQPWFGDVPEDAKSNTEQFLAEVFDDKVKSSVSLAGVKIKLKDTSYYADEFISLEEQIGELHNENSNKRAQAAWNLMVSDFDVPMETLTRGLEDENATVRWFLTESLHKRLDQESAMELALSLLLDKDEYVRVSAADLIIRVCEADPMTSMEVLLNSSADQDDIAYIVSKVCTQNMDSAEDILQNLVNYSIKADDLNMLISIFPMLKSLALDDELDQERLRQRKSVYFAMIAYLFRAMSRSKLSRSSMRILEDFWPSNALVRWLSIKIASSLEIQLPKTRPPRISGEDVEEILGLMDGELEETARDGKINMLAAMLLLGRKPTRIVAAKVMKNMGGEAVLPIIAGIEVTGVNTLMLSAGTVAEVLKEIDPDPVRSLLNILENDDTAVQQGVMLVLRALGMHKAVTPLVELLEDRRFRLRIFVVRALGGIRGVKATKGLIAALNDGNMRVRMEALQQLQNRIESPEVSEAVSKCRSDRSKHVRALAREILRA